jgi:hypothetical protein
MDQNNILCDMVSKGCVKSLILVNNLVCNGQHLLGLEVLVVLHINNCNMAMLYTPLPYVVLVAYTIVVWNN